MYCILYSIMYIHCAKKDTCSIIIRVQNDTCSWHLLETEVTGPVLYRDPLYYYYFKTKLIQNSIKLYVCTTYIHNHSQAKKLLSIANSWSQSVMKLRLLLDNFNQSKLLLKLLQETTICRLISRWYKNVYIRSCSSNGRTFWTAKLAIDVIKWILSLAIHLHERFQTATDSAMRLRGAWNRIANAFFKRKSLLTKAAYLAIYLGWKTPRRTWKSLA